MKKRAFVFTFNNRLLSLTDLLLKSIDYDCLKYDIYALYIPSDDAPSCPVEFDVNNCHIENVTITSSSDNIYKKDNYDARFHTSRNPIKNRWIKLISAQWFESRKVLYEKVIELIDLGYDQITVSDSDFFICSPEGLNDVLTTAPDDTLTAQMFVGVEKRDLIPDMLENNYDFVTSIPDYDSYYKMDGECIHTITIGTEQFKKTAKEFYKKQACIPPGDWMWDAWRLGIGLFVTENNCANVITRDHQLSFVFAAISYCIPNVTADHEPEGWVCTKTSEQILDAVYTAADDPGSVLRKLHTSNDMDPTEQWNKLKIQINALRNKWK